MQSAQSGGRHVALALMTTGTRHAAGILDALDGRGIRPGGIILEAPRGGALLGRIGDAWARRGPRATLGAITRAIIARLRPSSAPWRHAAYYADRGDRLFVVGDLASEESLAALRELRPDLLLLAGAPILPSAIVEVPRVGTLNAHPGLLPRYRGVDVVAHAVLDDDDLGATVHFVDAGIDTGRIVSRTTVARRPGDSLASLQERVEASGRLALADAVAAFIERGELPTEVQADRHPLCRRLTPEQRRKAEALLRSSL